MRTRIAEPAGTVARVGAGLGTGAAAGLGAGDAGSEDGPNVIPSTTFRGYVFDSPSDPRNLISRASAPRNVPSIVSPDRKRNVSALAITAAASSAVRAIAIFLLIF